MSELIKNERLFTVLRAPHLSEKSVRLQEVNQYVFEVAPDADKALVKAAVEAMFNVKVHSVNLANVMDTRQKIEAVQVKYFSIQERISEHIVGTDYFLAE